jgi:serine protease Do
MIRPSVARTCTSGLALVPTVVFPFVVLLAMISPAVISRAVGQQITGLQAAAAMEEVLVKAIAQSERSVVAIARVRQHDNDRLDFAPNAFNQFRQPQRPGDGDFIPNEYATGIVVDANGLILTAYHVLRDDSDYWVTTADRKTYKVRRVRGADPRSDLAVLEIEATDLVPIKFGDATKLKKGQIVIALGNPYAIARDGQASASWGIVSNLDRKDVPSIPERDGTTTPKPTLHQHGTLIQTDARLNLGTSGGALLNLKGEMVGMTVALSASLGYEQSAGFALPVDELFLRALGTLKQGREVEYGLLGVRLPEPSDPRPSQGVKITGVADGTPADRSHLLAGDVITQVNHRDVHDSDELMLNIGKLPTDDSVQLTVQRDGRTMLIQVDELAKYWVSGKKIVTTPSPAWRGIRVDYMTASREFQFPVPQRRLDLQGAVLVTEVQENSPAWKEGLRPDMMISHVGGNRVATPKQFHQEVAGTSGPVKLRINLPTGERAERVIPPDAD